MIRWNATNRVPHGLRVLADDSLPTATRRALNMEKQLGALEKSPASIIPITGRPVCRPGTSASIARVLRTQRPLYPSDLMADKQNGFRYCLRSKAIFLKSSALHQRRRD